MLPFSFEGGVLSSIFVRNNNQRIMSVLVNKNSKVMECHQTNAPVKNNTKLLQNVPVQLRPQIVDLLDFLRQSGGLIQEPKNTRGGFA